MKHIPAGGQHVCQGRNGRRGRSQRKRAGVIGHLPLLVYNRGSDVLLQCFDQLLRLLSRVHIGMGLQDGSSRAYHVGDAFGGFGVTAVAGAVGDADRALGIAQQRIGELVLLREPGIGLDIVSADAENLHVLAIVFLDSVTESNPLCRSPTGTGARVEPENDCLIRVVVEIDDGAGVVDYCETRRLVADIEHPLLLIVVAVCPKEGSMLTLSRGLVK